MKVRVFEVDYDSDRRDYQTDWVEVTQEDYDLLRVWYNVEILKDISYFLEDARARQKRKEAADLQYYAREQARKEKAAKAAKTRKEKLLAKLKKELEDESNS